MTDTRSSFRSAGSSAFGVRSAIALGAICSEHPGLLTSAGRGEDWNQAVLRGQILPTRASVELFAGIATAQKLGFDVLAILREVEDRPFGEASRRFYSEYLESPPLIVGASSAQLAIGGGLDPLVESVRMRDRLVLTGPVVQGLGFAALQTLLLLAVFGATASLAFPSVVALPAILSLIFVGHLGPVEKAMSWVTRWRRTNADRIALARLRNRRRRDGLPIEYRTSWYQPGEAPHLVPSRREAVLRTGGMADLLERLEAMVLLNMTIALVFALGTAWPKPIASLAFATIGLLLFVVLQSLGEHRRGYQARLHDELTAGVGFLEDSTKS